MELTREQQIVYNSLTYEWKSLLELNTNKIILDELVKLGLVESKIGNPYSYKTWVNYRKANKRIMVG